MPNPPRVEMPSDPQFWDLVHTAGRDWPAFERDIRLLEPPTLAGFAHMFYGLEAVFTEHAETLDLYDDHAEDFAGWMVGRGKEPVLAALRDLDRIDQSTLEEFEATSKNAGIDIRYEAEKVFHERTGESLSVPADPLFDPEDSSLYGPLLAES